MSCPAKQPSLPRKANGGQFKKTLALTTMVLPGAIWYLLLRYLPMGGIVMSFLDYKLPTRKIPFPVNLFHSKWVGLKNFSFLFTSESWVMIRNTLGYNALWIVMGLLLSVTFAIMMSELTRKFLAKTYQTLMFFPHFLSWVVVSYFVFAFLNTDYGTLNRVIMFFGGEPHRWYSEATYWPLFFVILKVWKGTGYGMVVYLATITGIDGSLYEAAMLDGASKWQQTRYITMPMLKTVIVMMFILSVGGIFASDFGLFYQVTQGVPNSLYKVASTFDTYVYAALQGNAPIGKTAAASTFQSVACCITILLTNFIVSKVDSDSAVF